MFGKKGTMTASITYIRQREESPARWHRALLRALQAGLEVRQLAGSGQWIVTSASDPGAAYETDGIDCTCPAAMLGGDPVCQHRAVFRYARMSTLHPSMPAVPEELRAA
jgi:hypothetical protein